MKGKAVIRHDDYCECKIEGKINDVHRVSVVLKLIFTAMRFENTTVLANYNILNPLTLVERPSSWPLLHGHADDAKYFTAGNFSIRSDWTVYANHTIGADPEDVQQNQLGECWLASTLKAVAACLQSTISKNLVRKGATQFVYHMVVPLNDTAFVPIAVPIDASVTAEDYSESLVVTMSSQQKAIIWPSLIEKAVAKVLIEYCNPFNLPCAQENPSQEQSLDVLNGGDPAMLLTMLTKENYIDTYLADLSDADILDIGKSAEKHPVIISTYAENICLMAPNHALWFQGLDADGLLLIHNPWWDEHTRTYTMRDFRREVEGLTVPAAYKTQSGLHPKLAQLSAPRQHMFDTCNGVTVLFAIGAVLLFSAALSGVLFA